MRILAQESVPSIVRQAQLIALVDDIQQQMAALDIISARRITLEQQRVIVLSSEHVQALIRAYGLLPRVNTVAVARLAAGAVQGAPIQSLLAMYSSDAGEKARQVLVRGAILGDNPLKIAQDLRGAMQTAQYAVERVARTEVLRAYRGAVQERTKEQGFNGVVWVCSANACAYCWSMSGTVYPSEMAMDTHPNCECSWAPNIGPDNAIHDGEDAFAELPDAKQRDILGPTKFNAYKDGRIALSDLAGHAVHPIWGPIGYEKSLAELGLR